MCVDGHSRLVLLVLRERGRWAAVRDESVAPGLAYSDGGSGEGRGNGQDARYEYSTMSHDLS
jgi:hypothetical protein